ncbi:hypothetical protein [Micromonospora sp. WMMD812]|uniref:hypothetical protein n=1 Tax=Micromonospora sp. WMMD812 TaxID=3015152 RepID=UPI00248D329F|nr:hypothetical protein [Micromonospora sp. WMMD812]WBB69922.1 hypothetical protein O7603_11435 [Micromonospora sp. WMMD812]
MTGNKGRGGGQAPRDPEVQVPWGTRDVYDTEPPFGVEEDSPMDEGSEETAVPEGRRGERRAGAASGPSGPAGRHGFGPVEPSRRPEAGPGAPPDPAPSGRTFPDDVDVDERVQDAFRARGRRTA